MKMSPNEAKVLRAHETLRSSPTAYVKMVDLRRAAKLSRDDFDLALYRLRRGRVLSADPSEGRHSRVTADELAAGIKEGGQVLTLVHARQSETGKERAVAKKAKKTAAKKPALPKKPAPAKKAAKKKATPAGAWCIDSKALAQVRSQLQMQKAKLSRVSSMLTRRAAKAARGSRYLALSSADKAKLAAVGLHVDELLSKCRQFK